MTPTASYTVIASNQGGGTGTTLTITVKEAPPAEALPNMGQQITPLAQENSRFQPMNPDLPDNPAWLAGYAVSTVVSPDPDHKTLLVLTSGYNRVYSSTTANMVVQDSTEYVFIYDISTPTPSRSKS